MAMGARTSPIAATIAPVTAGGISRSIQRSPATITTTPMTVYSDARRDDAAERDADVRVRLPDGRPVAAITGPMKAKLEPR